MRRADQGMPFMLRYENVAWYENGTVRILDRRIYPIRVEFVVCESYTEVAAAIRDMVTQSGGPYLAAAMGMVLAVYEAVHQKSDNVPAFLREAAWALSHARVTTSVRMVTVVNAVLDPVLRAVESGLTGGALIDLAFECALEQLNGIYRRNRKFGEYIAEKLPHGATVLTHCYGESVISGMLAVCKERNNPIRLICDETRPYFQGARLTASAAKDMGFDTAIITDGMSASIMHEEGVDLVVTGADLITMDGHVVNKVGTFSCALAAKYWGIPYYAAGNPCYEAKDRSAIHIEQRDTGEVLEYMGIRIALEGVNAYYPAFDVTPPEYCSGIITDKGIFLPGEVARYFDAGCQIR